MGTGSCHEFLEMHAVLRWVSPVYINLNSDSDLRMSPRTWTKKTSLCGLTKKICMMVFYLGDFLVTRLGRSSLAMFPFLAVSLSLDGREGDSVCLLIYSQESIQSKVLDLLIWS